MKKDTTPFKAELRQNSDSIEAEYFATLEECDAWIGIKLDEYRQGTGLVYHGGRIVSQRIRFIHLINNTRSHLRAFESDIRASAGIVGAVRKGLQAEQRCSVVGAGTKSRCPVDPGRIDRT